MTWAKQGTPSKTLDGAYNMTMKTDMKQVQHLIRKITVRGLVVDGYSEHDYVWIGKQIDLLGEIIQYV